MFQKHLRKLELATNEKDLQQLITSFQQELPKEEKLTIQIVHKVFLGDLLARKTDSLNNKSSSLYKEASLLANNSSNTSLQIWAYTQTGFYYYSYNEYIKATPYFLKSIRLLSTVTNEDLLDGVEVLKKNAYFFSTVKDYDKSIKLLNRALKQTLPNSKNYGNLLNNIGGNYLDQGNLEKASFYFKKTKESALRNKDEVRYAKALGDLARVAIKRKNWQEAETLLLHDIAISEKNKNDRNTMYARLQLGNMYLKKEDIAHAFAILTQVQQYASSKSYLKGYEQESTSLLLQIAMHKKNDSAELALRRKLDTLRFITKTENKDAINEIALHTQNEEVLWELEAKKIKLQKEQQSRWMWSIISLLLVVVVFLLFTLYHKRLKQKESEFKQNLLSFENDKKQSEKKLNIANSSLEAYKTYLFEKNQQIRELEQLIQTIKNNTSEVTTDETDALNEILNSHLMTDKNWMLFKQAFIDEQKEYYDNLLKNFPGLTESNLRIILLQKVGLNNQDTAQILGITIDAVKKAKQRLRKKYNEKFDIISNNNL